jgi:lipopolysaccharide export system protein LptA
MPHARSLLLVAILFILAGVGGVYHLQKKLQMAQEPARPHPLPMQLNAAAPNWCVTKSEGIRPIVQICAKSFQQIKEPPRMELDGVELHLFRNPPTEYDKVRSAKATFTDAQNTLYSDGDVEITRGVPADDAPHGRLMVIRSSGVSFDSKTGKATTERPTSFEFDQGDGKSVGATYDPSTHELRLHNQVELHWRGRHPDAKPMKVEAGQVIYKETESKVFLLSGAKLTREAMTLEVDLGVVTLEDGVIRVVEGPKARGADRLPGRQLEYSADSMRMQFNEDGKLERLHGDGHTHLVSTTPSGQTNITTDLVELEFDTSGEDSTLKHVLASGHSVVHSDAIPKPGVPPPQSRVLRSEVIELYMRKDGREIDRVETHAPGRMEFLATRNGERYRRMDGDRIEVFYAAENRIRAFKAVGVTTLTEPERGGRRKNAAPSKTWSQGLQVDFDPASGEMTKLRQWGDFRYEEGTRRAKARDAMLEQATNLITLDGGARSWDPTGSVLADHIVLDQNTGDFTAVGNVSSNRAPDKKGSSSAMLSQEEPMQARADSMSSKGSNTLLHFEGHALVWQGGNRLRAKVIDIDREHQRLKAGGGVISELLDRAKSAPAAKKPVPVYTVVRAEELLYLDDSRLAHYQGGVLLRRSGMDVKSRELRAYLNDADQDSSLEKAFADGAADIVQTAAGRTRRGTAEHAEYYVSDQKVILHGGAPTFSDSVKGATHGERLTYFADNDRLLVEGLPAKSRIHRK